MLQISRPARLLVSFAVSTALLSACAIGPDYKRPEATGGTGIDHYKNTGHEGAPAAQGPQAQLADRWWTVFNDPILNGLEDQVVVSNQNIAQAAAAYAQARAVVRQDRSALWPTFGLTGGATNTGGPAGQVVPGQPHTTYQMAGSTTWELDIWGKLRRQLENAKASSEASAADLAYARLSAQSALAIAYLQLRGADAERKMLADTETAYALTLKITQNRYVAGTAAKTDVLSAQTQVYSAQNQEQSIILTRAQLENSIAALIGRAATVFSIAPLDEWNLPAPALPSGLPSELLKRRPDVAAAERQMAAANAIIGVQEAAYFPSITLTGDYGFTSTALHTLFDSGNMSHSVAGSLSQTLLDFGGRKAQVDQARDAYASAIASYRQTVITAFQDVENDLASANIYGKEFDILTQDSQAADLSEKLTINQYKAGTADMTAVMVAQTTALTARVSLAQMRVLQQTTAVSLVTDLGGGWQAPDYTHYY